MIIPKKQMLIAIGAIILLIILSVAWIVISAKTTDDPVTQPKINDLNGTNDLDDPAPLIKIILINKTDCENCTSLDFLVQTIKTEFDLNVLEVKEVDSASEEGKNLIAMHEITSANLNLQVRPRKRRMKSGECSPVNIRWLTPINTARC